MNIKSKWCYGCNEIKPLIPEYWAYANKEILNLEINVENALIGIVKYLIE